MNEYKEFVCNKCPQKICHANFYLGAELKKYDKGQLKQFGNRFIINGCFAKELDDYIDYIWFYQNFKTFGLPFSGGWAEMPLFLIRVLELFESEKQYLRE